MDVSVRDAVVLHAGYPTLKEGLAGLEVDAVELTVDRGLRVRALTPVEGEAFFDLSNPSGVESFRRQYESAGIRPAGFLLANNFNAEDLEAELDWVIRAVRLAEELGVPAVRIDSAMRGEREMPFEARVQRFVECLRRVFDATSNAKVPLGIENHGFQGNDPAFLDAVLEGVGNPRLGLTLDTGNFYWRGHPLSRVYAIIEHFAPHVKHTHVKNIAYPPEVREQEREMGWQYGKYVSPIPEGDIDHVRVVKMLKAAGYDRDLCAEDESLGKFAGEERRQVLRRDVDYLKSLI